MNKAFLIDIAEALYQIRCGRDAGRVPPLIKMHLEYAEGKLTEILRGVGLDTGKTAVDADNLKVAVTKIEDNEPVGKVIEVEKEIKIEIKIPVDRVQVSLETASQISGSDGIHREFSRFAEFYSRALYAKPDAPLIQDDKEFPVYAWIRDRCPSGVPFDDMSLMAELYVAWTEITCKDFLKKMSQKKSLTDLLNEIK